MQEVVQAIVWSLLNSIWQSALLWLGYLSFYRNSTTVSKKQFLLTSLIVQIAASAILFSIKFQVTLGSIQSMLTTLTIGKPLFSSFTSACYPSG